MRMIVSNFSAAALALSLAACGGTEPANNIAADELNSMTNVEELPPAEPVANVTVAEPITETRQPEPAAPKPTPAKPATAQPKPDPTPAKPAPEPAAEARTTAPSCPPEHHAAGHC